MGIARLNYLLSLALISIALNAPSKVLAQSLPGSQADQSAGGAASGDNDVEALYDKDEAKTPAKKEAKPAPAPKPDVDVQNLSDLAKLAPFSDVAVIQRRFLPKTKRFEGSVGVFTNLNNPFFTAYGLDLKLAYYLTERWAIIGIADFAATAARQVTDDLSKNRKINTSNLVTSTGFYGAALKWNPIYGKITWLNKSIVPFDISFDLGGGATQIKGGQSVMTYHAGVSQVFAYTKSSAFRWDFAMNRFSANALDENNRKVTVDQNDIYLGIGMSFYFPEATYR